MKEINLTIICALLALFSFVCCTSSPQVDNALAEAERLMEEYPDSALAILDAIPTSRVFDSF